MANIRNYQPVVGIKKLMIFYIGCDVEVGTSSYCSPDEEAACTAAKSYSFYRLTN